MEVGPELFRRLVEASRDGLWIVDTSGRSIFANARWSTWPRSRTLRSSGL